MSDYTKKNLSEIPNSAADRGTSIDARFARSHIDSEHLGISLFRIEPNFRIPFAHRHREQEEAYVVVEGSGRMRLDDDIVELGQWDIIRVAPHVVRSFEAGPDGLAYIAVGNDRPEGCDGEMVQDFWTD
jgi:mannose-6-phosphate isomerase-like protein (cupin superfamily)